MTESAATSSAMTQPSLGDRIGRTWLDFWFTPTDPSPLAMARILTGVLGLMLAASYAGDLVTWFGSGGMIPPESIDGWRQRSGRSLIDGISTAAGLQVYFAILLVALIAVTVGLASQIACVVAAVLWAALLNRGAMLAGPADDCLSILLWCLAVGPCGATWSFDRLIRDRRGLPPPSDSPWASTSLGLLRLHAAVIPLGMLLSQLKGDVWWNGSASWWLTAAHGFPFADLQELYRQSEYVMNFVTHGFVVVEILFVVGLWFDASRQTICRMGLVAWPLIGLIAGEPYFGLAMAVFCVPWVSEPPAMSEAKD